MSSPSWCEGRAAHEGHRYPLPSLRADAQESEIKKWLDGHGIAPESVVWYRDKESGKTLARPEFDRLQQDIFKGAVSMVLFWKLDRMSRRLRDGVNLLSDWCDKGVRIVVITQQIDLSEAVGRMVAAVLLGLAEIELEFWQERQMAGIEVARRKGVYKGRTKGNPDRARELSDKGLNAAEIATALGTSERTVFRYLGGEAKQ